MFTSLAIIAILATLLMAAPARADNTRIYFTGYEPGCDEWVVSRVLEPGPNLQLKIYSQTCHDVAIIPQFTGTNYAHDGILNVVGGGQFVIVHGKFRFESDEGGIWVGLFNLPANSTTLTAVGHGEGIYAGQDIHVFMDNLTSQFWGYIDTHE